MVYQTTKQRRELAEETLDVWYTTTIYWPVIEKNFYRECAYVDNSNIHG